MIFLIKRFEQPDEVPALRRGYGAAGDRRELRMAQFCFNNCVRVAVG